MIEVERPSSPVASASSPAALGALSLSATAATFPFDSRNLPTSISLAFIDRRRFDGSTPLSRSPLRPAQLSHSDRDYHILLRVSILSSTALRLGCTIQPRRHLIRRTCHASHAAPPNAPPRHATTTKHYILHNLQHTLPPFPLPTVLDQRYPA